jgi:hypothetical protein
MLRMRLLTLQNYENYSLNPNHPEGKHKARVLLRTLGIDRNDAEQLRQIVLKAVLTTDAIEQKPTEFGRRFVVDFQVSWVKKSMSNTATVRTAWIIRNDENFPRLTTCFSLERST